MKIAPPFFLTAALGLLAFANASCENKAIGRTCIATPGVDPSMVMSSQAVFNDQALECPTRLCIKPAKEATVGTDQGTLPFCTDECKSNSDCSDAERRDMSNARDKRCTKGFACGIAFETGPLKCKKLCICKDFVPDTGPTVPATCAQK